MPDTGRLQLSQALPSLYQRRRWLSGSAWGWAGWGWVGLGWAGWGWAGLGGAGLGWVGLGWVGQVIVARPDSFSTWGG
ncbi:hypothetical protein E3T28_12355 [Cryobacterium sinapicolor]|uniref:Uncharacterized protein n=1 Tax=Cryobacterium sinapicolor TaxID=1259236 RepID=A0ABY2IX13_9MICO|nr:hypothetical protein E3T28_12355 [Cryobacterium sinapicolor]